MSDTPAPRHASQILLNPPLAKGEARSAGGFLRQERPLRKENFKVIHRLRREQLDFHNLGLLDDLMRGLFLSCLLWSVIVLPGPAEAVTPSPALTDWEIAERLTRLETRLDEGLTGLRSDIAQLRTDVQEQNRQLREDMNTRFEEHSRLILGILAAFAALFVVRANSDPV